MYITRKSLHEGGYCVKFGTTKEDCENAPPNDHRHNFPQVKQSWFQEVDNRNRHNACKQTHEANIDPTRIQEDCTCNGNQYSGEPGGYFPIKQCKHRDNDQRKADLIRVANNQSFDKKAVCDKETRAQYC